MAHPRPWPAACLVLVAVLAPAQAGSTYGAQGVPVDEGCATDMGGDETMAPGVDGSLLFPGADCSATFAVGNATDLLAIKYNVGGQPQGCGLWQFTGGFVGLSELQCATSPATFVAPVDVERADGPTYTVTWIPTSWRHETASLCAIATEGPDAPADLTTPELDCAQTPASAECQEGLAVEATPGRVQLEWPDVPAAYYYNASAVRLDPEPVRLWYAQPGLMESRHALAQEGGTYSYVVTAFSPEHHAIATFCQVTRTVPPGAEVPFFAGRLAIAGALAAVLVAGFVLVRRRA